MYIEISELKPLGNTQKIAIIKDKNGQDIVLDHKKVYTFYTFDNTDPDSTKIASIPLWCTKSGEGSFNDIFNRRYERAKNKTLKAELDFIEEYRNKKIEEQNKYFSEKNLKEAVGEQGLQQMKEVEIKPGKAFLNGEDTNITCSSTTNNTTDNTTNNSSLFKLSNYTSEIDIGGIISPDPMSGILNTTMNLSSRVGTEIGSSQLVSTVAKGTAVGLGTMQIGKDLVQNAPDIIISLSQAIIGNITSTITTEMTKATTGYLGKHASAVANFPSQIMSYAMSYFNANKMSISDVLKTLNDSAEERSEKSNNENNEKSKSNFLKNAQKESKEFIGKINKYVDIGTSYIGMVTSYIQNGPDWVIEQANKQIGSFVNLVNTEVDKQWEKDKKRYDDRARTYGEKVGAEMVAKYNNNLKKTQKKLKEKMDKMKTKNMTKLFANKAKGAAKLASITGIYIPV